jgi:hypothetical protein
MIPETVPGAPAEALRCGELVVQKASGTDLGRIEGNRTYQLEDIALRSRTTEFEFRNDTASKNNIKSVL